MDISSIGGNASDIAEMFALNGNEKVEETEEPSDVEAKYAVKLIKMAQQADAIVGTILEDTVEISQEAMQKFMSERG